MLGAKRLLGKLKKKPKDGEQKQQKPVQQKHPQDSDEYGSEYTDTDDERVHDFEIGQENYLLQVALATSAQDYDHNSTNGIAAEAATPGACELSKKYWRDGRCVSGQPVPRRGLSKGLQGMSWVLCII